MVREAKQLSSCSPSYQSSSKDYFRSEPSILEPSDLLSRLMCFLSRSWQELPSLQTSRALGARYGIYSNVCGMVQSANSHEPTDLSPPKCQGRCSSDVEDAADAFPSCQMTEMFGTLEGHGSTFDLLLPVWGLFSSVPETRQNSFLFIRELMISVNSFCFLS